MQDSERRKAEQARRPYPDADDLVTVIAIAVLASIVQNVLHEGCGHGLAAYLSGAHTITLSTVAENSEINSRWIDAAGTLVNLVAGAVFWILLRARSYAPEMRLFLLLAMMGNLFSGTGYFLFSGIAGFGDWEAVTRGWSPAWAWRVGLIVVGVASYFGAMRIVAAEYRPFVRGHTPRRIRRLAWVPYGADGVLALFAGLLNPLGLFYVVASALPATLGANAGLWSMPGMARAGGEGDGVGWIRRSWPWIAVGTVIALVFTFVLGRSVTWKR